MLKVGDVVMWGEGENGGKRWKMDGPKRYREPLVVVEIGPQFINGSGEGGDGFITVKDADDVLRNFDPKERFDPRWFRKDEFLTAVHNEGQNKAKTQAPQASQDENTQREARK